MGLALTTGPAPPVGVAGMGGALPQAVAANAMLAAIAASRTGVVRRECGRIKNALAPNPRAQPQHEGTVG